MRVQGRGGVLEDDLHLALAFLPQVRGRVVDVVPVEEDAARGGRIQAHDGPGQRGLAAAGLPHQTEHLAPADGKVEPVHGPDGQAPAGTEVQTQILQFQ